MAKGAAAKGAVAKGAVAKRAVAKGAAAKGAVAKGAAAKGAAAKRGAGNPLVECPEQWLQLALICAFATHMLPLCSLVHCIPEEHGHAPGAV